VIVTARLFVILLWRRPESCIKTTLGHEEGCTSEWDGSRDHGWRYVLVVPF